MNQIPIDIPGAQVTYNYLYENMPVDWREEDLLFVKLPNGCVIDVGWYPACDPDGWFKITLSDSAQNEIEAIKLRELERVRDAAQRLATGTDSARHGVTSISVDDVGAPRLATLTSTNASDISILTICDLDLSRIRVA
jgi:hypothetical protein